MFRRVNLSSHLSLDREGRLSTTDDFAASFLYFLLLSTALWDLVNSKPVHSLMFSSHLFLCLTCLLPSFTVPCKMLLARPDERETYSHHCSLCLLQLSDSLSSYSWLDHYVHTTVETLLYRTIFFHWLHTADYSYLTIYKQQWKLCCIKPVSFIVYIQVVHHYVQTTVDTLLHQTSFFHCLRTVRTSLCTNNSGNSVVSNQFLSLSTYLVS